MPSVRLLTVGGWGCPGVTGECVQVGRGVQGRGVSGVWTGGVHPHFVNRIADRCKNITFPQLRLLTVKTHGEYKHFTMYCWTFEKIEMEWHKDILISISCENMSK